MLRESRIFEPERLEQEGVSVDTMYSSETGQSQLPYMHMNYLQSNLIRCLI